MKVDASMSPRILARTYFSRPTLTVARGLLGKYLVHQKKAGTRVGRIVEVEAYIGPEDRASHASRGRTSRTELMFGPAGMAYVYLIYGMYHCLNVVTERAEYPAAILIRAVELDSAHGWTLVDGPGRLCRALGIDRSHNGLDLTAGTQIWIEHRGGRITPDQVLRAPRIGVPYAGAWAKKPWRFRLAQARGPAHTPSPGHENRPTK